MTTSINVAGTWKDPSEVKVNVAGTWRTVSTIEINVGGTWKQVYPNATVSLAQLPSGIVDVQFGVPASALLEIQSDGDIYEQTNGGGGVDDGDWVTPTSAAGAAYDVRATLNSGALTAGTTGTWMSLSASRGWSVTQNSAGTAAANLTIEIRDAVSLVVLATGSLDLQADYI